MGLALLAFVISAVPIIRLGQIVLTTGADVPSNDDLLSMGLIQRILGGHYEWSNFLYDTFVANSHLVAVPMLIRLAVIQLTGWNVYVELGIGLVLNVLKLAFLYATIAPAISSRARLLLLPGLSALLFSTSQTDVFGYGDTGLELSLNQCGLVVGIWALLKFRRRWRGVLIMIAAGTVATWSGAGGLAVWPAFALVMLWLGYRNAVHYVVALFGMAVALAPYVYFFLIRPKPWAGYEALIPLPRNKLHFTVDLPYLLVAIGDPFRYYKGVALIACAGIAGSLLTLALVFLVWSRRSEAWAWMLAPATGMCIYGYLNLCLTMGFRTELAPWYATHFLPIWLGLVLAAAVMLSQAGSDTGIRIIAVVSFAITGALWTVANARYPEGLLFIPTRSDASASCVRNYHTAPTYCESYVFAWSEGHPGFLTALARPLQEHHLSVFGSQEMWTLQGDFVLDTVKLSSSDSANAFWADGRSFARVPWYDIRHLNLWLRAGNLLSWRLRVPQNAVKATFRTALISSRGRLPSITASVEAAQNREPGAKPRVLPVRTWTRTAGESIGLPLVSYRGRVLTLDVSVHGARSAWAELSRPVVQVEVNLGRRAGPGMPPTLPPAPTSEDLKFDTQHSSAWTGHNSLADVEGAALGIAQERPGGFLTYARPLNACLLNYDYVYARASAPIGLWPRAFYVWYRLAGQRSYYRARSLPVPLLADGAQHTYWYPIRLFQLEAGARLVGIRLSMADTDGFAAGERIVVRDLRLIRDRSKHDCASPVEKRLALETRPHLGGITSIRSNLQGLTSDRPHVHHLDTFLEPSIY